MSIFGMNVSHDVHSFNDYTNKMAAEEKALIKCVCNLLKEV